MFSQKVKLIKILEILKLHSDEDHPMSTKELLKKLSDIGISCDRKTLYNDIEVLNDNGYEILTERKNSNQYKIVDRRFEAAEIRILIDAIDSAKFITKSKTEKLISKMEDLVGNPKINQLVSSYRRKSCPKTTNENVYYSVDRIDTAILENKQISFQYFDLDLSGKRLYRKGGERYIVNPIALGINDSKYYMIAYLEDDNQEARNYRVDKMDSVEIDTDDRVFSPLLSNFDINKHIIESVDMFGGQKKDIQLLCTKAPEMIGQLKDQFGEEIKIFDYSPLQFTAHIEVSVSPTLFSWVFTYGDKIKITSPSEVVEEFKLFLNKALSLYKN